MFTFWPFSIYEDTVQNDERINLMAKEYLNYYLDHAEKKQLRKDIITSELSGYATYDKNGNCTGLYSKYIMNDVKCGTFKFEVTIVDFLEAYILKEKDLEIKKILSKSIIDLKKYDQ